MLEEMYKLFHKKTLIGTIQPADTGLPSATGIFQLEQQPLPTKIKSYIDYSRKSAELMIEDEEKAEEYIDQNENTHLPLMESKAWILQDEAGLTRSILTPIFFEDNTITWHYSSK